MSKMCPSLASKFSGVIDFGAHDYKYIKAVLLSLESGMFKRAIGITLSLLMIGLPLAAGQVTPSCLNEGHHSSAPEGSNCCSESRDCDRGCCCSRNASDGIGQCTCKDISHVVFLAGTSVSGPIPSRVPLATISIELDFPPKSVTRAERSCPEYHGASGFFLQDCCFLS